MLLECFCRYCSTMDATSLRRIHGVANDWLKTHERISLTVNAGFREEWREELKADFDYYQDITNRCITELTSRGLTL